MSFLAEMDKLIEHTESFSGHVEDIINQINIKACQYVKRNEMVRENDESNRVKEWLKENKVKAVPFDKGCGFALMSDKGYDEKINNILNGRQFEVKKLRSNSSPIEQIEQERINKTLDGLKTSKHF